MDTEANKCSQDDAAEDDADNCTYTQTTTAFVDAFDRGKTDVSRIDTELHLGARQVIDSVKSKAEGNTCNEIISISLADLDECIGRIAFGVIFYEPELRVEFVKIVSDLDF